MPPEPTSERFPCPACGDAGRPIGVSTHRARVTIELRCNGGGHLWSLERVDPNSPIRADHISKNDEKKIEGSD